MASSGFLVDPVVMSTEVADYSSVPPTSVYSTPTETLNSVNLAPKSSSSDAGIWDYGQNGVSIMHGGADFNMEAPISEDDVIRAGGFGARDELDRLLPAAADATDYEESLNHAMEYEDVQPALDGAVSRPGVGFVKDPQRNIDEDSGAQQNQAIDRASEALQK